MSHCKAVAELLRAAERTNPVVSACSCCSCCDLSCSAVRDAAIECLEEVYKVYGEQLMDVLSSHQLRPAHLNLIYNRLAQLGAQVEHTPVQSGEGTTCS